MKKVPNNIPPDIVKLDLSYNKINQLRPKEFEDVHMLKKLNLSSNGIEFIDPGKFHRITGDRCCLSFSLMATFIVNTIKSKKLNNKMFKFKLNVMNLDLVN